MNIDQVQKYSTISASRCRNLILTNEGADSPHTVMLPGLKESILGPIVFLGVTDQEVTFESVEDSALVGADGTATSVTIEAAECRGAAVTFVKLPSGAWHVSANVPLVFE